MSFLIAGDLHLGKGLSIGKPGVGLNLNSRVIDQIKLLDWVLNTAFQRGVKRIILTGDICEAIKPDYILVELFIDWLKRCDDNGIEVHIIAGNHDLRRTGTKHASYLDLISTADLPSVFIYKNISTISDDDYSITFVPFRDLYSMNCQDGDEAMGKIRQALNYESAGINPSCQKILVGHLALEGAIYVGDEFDNLSRELMCPMSLFEEYNYVWMGHVHKPQVMYEEDNYIAHVGSLDISDFGETDHQKILIHFDATLPHKFEEIIVPSRPLRRVQLEVQADQDSTLALINKIKALDAQKSFKNAYVKIDVKLLDDDVISTDRELVLQCLEDLDVFHISSFQESRSISVMKLTNNVDIDSTIEPEKAIKIWVEQNDSEFDSDQERDDFISYCLEVINSQR